ncbi:MAG: endonuclease III [candidate division SR1 bacterium]|nr:endonuclease III [candidate division SR1 bacterium]
MAKISTKKFDQIFSYFLELYPNAQTELNFDNGFQLLVAVALSAQATDKQVNKVTASLFQKVKKPEDILQMGFEDFEQSIKSIGLYKSKAKNLRKTAQILAQGDGVIPSTQDELVKLPGVGEKTAKVILHVLYHQPVIAVDTHVHRICNRLGIVKTAQPLQTSKLLETLIPNQYKQIAHHAMILFGRYFCTARNPKCADCKLQEICRYYKDLPKTKTSQKNR